MKMPFFLVTFITALMIVPPMPAQEAAPSQALPEEPGTAAARAADVRRLADSFEGASYFPSEWEAAEELYAQGSFDAAADSYDSIFRLTVPLYAQAREDDIMEIRNELIARGARDHFYEYFGPADSIALQALSQYEAEDYYSAQATAANALNAFQTLNIAYDSWQKKREIDARDFILYDSDNYERAGEIISDAMEAYSAGDLETALEKTEEAYLRYSLVLSTAWAGYAEIRASRANGERLAAMDMKTDISASDYFKEADSDNTEAQALLETERYEEAARLFINAEAMFVIASMMAMERRQNAAAMIEETHGIIDSYRDTEAEGDIPHSIQEALLLLRHAQEAYNHGDYEASSNLANDAMYQLVGMFAHTQPAERESESESENESAPLPASYTVRPWAGSGDCFWNIAARPWVYGDPQQWRVLYNANRDKLPDPDNPNWIEPGMVIDIPSIRGEFRQGEFRD